MTFTTISTILLLLATFVSSVLHVLAIYRKDIERAMLFKPLTVILIITIAIISPEPPSTFYKASIIFALLMSLMGDIFLMIPGNPLITGLVPFLIAQLVYFVGFTSQIGWPITILWLLLTLLMGGGVGYFSWRRLDEMREPVAVYIAAILLMLWAAGEMWLQSGLQPALLAATGAVLFVVSDTVLGYDHFVKKFTAAPALIMGTYYVAQALFALSLHGVLW